MTAMIEPFHAMSVAALAQRLKAEGRSVIHMEFGQPSTGAPQAAIAAAHRVLDSDPMGYWESQPLKMRICQHYADTYGVTLNPAQIVLTCGASPALVLALSTSFAPGARVAVARPGYVAYRNTLRTLHMEPVELDCGADERFQLSAAALAALDPAPAGVILASPANPTGTIIPRDELEAIAAVCTARAITIVSDEIYHGIAYGMPTPSVLEVAPQALVINSFSKYFSMAGWRLGWLVVPESGIDAARARMGSLFSYPAQPGTARCAGGDGLHRRTAGQYRNVRPQSRAAACSDARSWSGPYRPARRCVLCLRRCQRFHRRFDAAL